MAFKRLSILGVGLLGGSIGLAAKAAITGLEVIGYGHRPATLKAALETGAIDEAVGTIAAAVAGADLVILATPVGVFEASLRQMAGALMPGAVVTDVGSTKRSVVALAERLLPKTAHFVGSHPMAGSEKRGVEFARADLFHNATCILTPTERTDPAALAAIEAFWRTLGMRLTRLTPAAHDAALADVSHLPHALAAALVTMQLAGNLPLAGKGFLDATRIAGGDGGLWRDILHDNADNVRASLLRLRGELDHLLELLDPKESAALQAWLDDAAKRRDELLRQKLGEVTPD